MIFQLIAKFSMFDVFQFFARGCGVAMLASNRSGE